MIRKVLNIKQGSAVTRQYRNAKKIRTFSAANVVVACSLGYQHARSGNNLTFLDMANIVLFGKITEKSHAVIKNLEPEYNQIVSRAKSIFGK